jgi:hypothetical protein
MGSCEWETLRGTGYRGGNDEPAIYRCIWSKSEDVDPKCINENAVNADPCCAICKCTCDLEEENFQYSPETGTSVAGREGP